MNTRTAKDVEYNEKNVDKLKLKAQVYTMVIKDNKTFIEVAKELGLNRLTVSKYYNELKQAKWLNVGDTKKALAAQLATLDTIEHTFTDSMLGGSVASAELILKVLQAKARLLGLNEPYKVAIQDDKTIQVIYPDNWRDERKFDTLETIEGEARHLISNHTGATVSSPADDDDDDYEGGDD